MRRRADIAGGRGPGERDAGRAARVPDLGAAVWRQGLEVSQPGDREEAEAGRIAAGLNLPVSPATMRGSGAADRGGYAGNDGRPLDSATRLRMEAGFGRDFGGVRLHQGGAASQSARALNARAYTIGSDIYLARGEYLPSSPTGQRLLAHELAHVVQHSDGGRLAAGGERDAGGAAPPRISREVRKADIQMLSDEELAAEHEAVQQYILTATVSDPEQAAYLQQLEAELSRRGPARERAAQRQAATAAALKKSSVVGAFIPGGLVGPAAAAFMSEYVIGLVDGFQEQPAERKGALGQRIQDINGWGHWGDKFEYSVGYMKGIALGVWGEVKGILELLWLIPQLQWKVNSWLLSQALQIRDYAALSAKATALYEEMQRLGEKLGADLRAAFSDPVSALKKLSAAFEGLLSAGLSKAYSLGLEGVDAAFKLAERPYRELGEGLGKIVGWTLVQLVLLFGTEAIGNLITRGASVAARIARGLIEGAGAVFRGIGALIGEVWAVIRAMGNTVLKGFETTLEALGELFVRARAFFDELIGAAEGLGAEAAMAGGGRMPPGALMSQGIEGGATGTRTTMTTVAELYPKTPPAGAGVATEAASAEVVAESALVSGPAKTETVEEFIARGGKVEYPEYKAPEGPSSSEVVRPRERPSEETVESLIGEGPEHRSMREVKTTRAGLAAQPRHHVFPQEFRAWFEKRGFKDIDDFTLELDEATHKALHGGGDWRLGRTWEGEWNRKLMSMLRDEEKLLGRELNKGEILAIGKKLIAEYKLSGPFVPYARPPR